MEHGIRTVFATDPAKLPEELALARPDRARSLVLVNSVGGSTWSHRGSALRSLAGRRRRDGGMRRRVASAAAGLGLLATMGGCGGGSGLPAVGGPTRDTLELEGSEFRYVPDKIAVAAGSVPVVLRNVGLVVHDLRIEGKPRFLVEAGPGQTATATWELPEGRFEIYCSIQGHRAAGMEGILEVRAPE